MKTTFSLIIPTYNRAGFILKTLQSVLNQTCKDFEIIIVDDGSTDNTQELISTVGDSRIKYFKKQHGERAAARNFGIERAAGDYITFLDSDDLLYPHHFEEAFNLIQKYNHPEWLHSGYEIRNEKGKILRQQNKRRGSINKSLITGNHLSCLGIFVRKDIAIENKFNEDRDIIGSEDYELWLRLAAKYQLYYSNEITGCMIQHTERSVMGFDQQKLVKRIEKLIEIVKSQNELNARALKKFKAHRYLYLSLHLAMNKDIVHSGIYLFKAAKTFPIALFSTKVLGILKTILTGLLR